MPTVGGDRNTWGGKLNELDFDAVSADWYSDPNDALDTAGAGGIVRFSKDTTYTLVDPLRLRTGQTLEGADRLTTLIQCTGEAGIMSGDTDALVQDVTLRNLRIEGGGVSAVGLDARYLTRCDFDRLRISNFTDHGVWFGGDQASDIAGWSNTLTRSRVVAMSGGDAIYLQGTVTSSGNPVANAIRVADCELPGGYGSGDAVVTIEEGENCVFLGNDLGYGNGSGSVAFRITGSVSRRNTFVGNRVEQMAASVECSGAYNAFVSNALVATDAAAHIVTLTTGHLRNSFVMNYTSGGLSPSFYDAVTAAEARGVIKPTGDVRTAGLIESNYALRTGSATTAGRPAASAVGQGGMIFDTTLNKPVWSDGTNWRDAAGTVV